MNIVAERLKQLRQDQGIRLTDLAQKVNMSHSYLSEIEQGKKIPSFKKLELLCSALGITLSDFFSVDKKPIPIDLLNLHELSGQLQPHQIKMLTEIVEALVEKNKRKNDF